MADATKISEQIGLDLLSYSLFDFMVLVLVFIFTFHTGHIMLSHCHFNFTQNP